MPPPEPQTRVLVRLKPSYEVLIGTGLTGALGETVAGVVSGAPGRAVLVCDSGVPQSRIAEAEASLARCSMRALNWSITPSEKDKSLDCLGALLSFMAAHHVERGESLIAFGGGVVGDLAGFAAATYRRGIPLIHCPTTLLAMVDASVGGKTAVNLRAPDGSLLKNMAGAFHQPRAVLIDVSTLESLPERQYRAGLAECLKHAMIAGVAGDPELWMWMWDHGHEIRNRNAAVLAELITRNVRIKAAIVERDEREEDPDEGRALLNLGHTFAHAIETIPGLSPDGDPSNSPLLHGEAVALGLVAATQCAILSRTCADEGRLAAVQGAVVRLGLPIRIAGLPPSPALLARMSDDKKVRSGRLRVVMPTQRGWATVVDNPDPAAVAAGWDAIRHPA